MSNGFFADPATARSLLGPIPVGISLGKRRRVVDFTDAERTQRTSRLMELLTAVYADSTASSSRVRYNCATKREPLLFSFRALRRWFTAPIGGTSQNSARLSGWIPLALVPL